MKRVSGKKLIAIFISAVVILCLIFGGLSILNKKLKAFQKKLETSTKVEETEFPYDAEIDNYKEIDKTFKLDNIDFKVLSLGNFNFGTLMPIFVGNISDDEGNQFAENYYVRIKSGDLNQMYNLDKWIGFYERPIKSYSKIDKSYNKDSKYDQFYMGKFLYNPKDVNKEDMEIYIEK